MMKLSMLLFSFLLVIGLSLSWADIPRFTVEPQSGFIGPGASVILSCDVLPHSISIRWLFNGSQVTPDRRKGIDVHEGTLRISSFNQGAPSKQAGGLDEPVSHEGAYQCVATGSSGSIVSREALLQPAVFGGYEGSRMVEDLQVVEGSVAVIPCTPPASRPEPFVEFDFNGTKIVPLGRHMILPSHSLQIADASPKDSGVYQCTAYNKIIGTRARSPVQYRLKVLGGGSRQAPTFVRTSPSSMTAVLGEELSLECAAGGWPTPNVTWEKYGGHLPTGRYRFVFGNLIISEVQMFDAGTYLCKISNGEGEPQAKVISVEVHEPPVIDSSPGHQVAKEGDTVTFKCRAHGTPDVSVEWFHNANPISTRPSTRIKDTSLVITNIKVNQKGMYQCMVRNKLRVTHASARLTVTENSNRPITAQPGKQPTNHIPSHDFSGSSDADLKEGGEVGGREYDDYGEGVGGRQSGSKSDKISSTNEHHGIRHGGNNQPQGHDLLIPTRPEVSRVRDSALLIQWSLVAHSSTSGGSGGSSLPISYFTLQYKDMGEGLSLTSSSAWRNLIEEIPATLRQYEIPQVRPGTYRFRIIATYTGGETRSGLPSHRIIVGSRFQNKIALPAPIIVETRPLTVSEIFIGWQQIDTDQWPIEGFYIYYAPYSEVTSTSDDVRKVGIGPEEVGGLPTSVGALVGEELRKPVQGASVRHAVLSDLKPGVQYRVRMQSYSSMLGESDFSNVILKRTLGRMDEGSPPYAAASGGTGAHGSSRVDKGGQLPSGQIEKEVIHSNDIMYNEYNGNKENHFLYVALGTVLGVVVLATVICLTMCIWKQHKRQYFSGSAKERQSLQNSNGVGTAFNSGPLITPKTSSLLNSVLMKSSNPTPPSSNSHLTTPSHMPGCGGTCTPSLMQQYSGSREGSSFGTPMGPEDTAAALALRDNAAAYQLKLGTGTLLNRKQPELVLPPPPPLRLPHGYSHSILQSGDICSESLSNSMADQINAHSGGEDPYDPSDHLYSRLKEPSPQHFNFSSSALLDDQFRSQGQPEIFSRSQGQGEIFSRSQGDHVIPSSHGMFNSAQGQTINQIPDLRRGVGLTAASVACPSITSLSGGFQVRMSPDHIPRSHERRLGVQEAPLPLKGQCRRAGNQNSFRNDGQPGGRIQDGEGRGVGYRGGWRDNESDDDDDVYDDNVMTRDQGTGCDLLSNNGGNSVYTTESDSNAYSSLDGRSLERSSPSQQLSINPSRHSQQPIGNKEKCKQNFGGNSQRLKFSDRNADVVEYDPVADAGYSIESDNNDDYNDNDDDDRSINDDQSSEDRRKFVNRTQAK